MKPSWRKDQSHKETDFCIISNMSFSLSFACYISNFNPCTLSLSIEMPLCRLRIYNTDCFTRIQIGNFRFCRSLSTNYPSLFSFHYTGTHICLWLFECVLLYIVLHYLQPTTLKRGYLKSDRNLICVIWNNRTTMISVTRKVWFYMCFDFHLGIGVLEKLLMRK